MYVDKIIIFLFYWNLTFVTVGVLLPPCNKLNTGGDDVVFQFWRVDLSSGTPRSTGASDMLQTDNEISSQETEHDRKHDVFISYRRQTGKHLAGSVSPSAASIVVVYL